MSESTSCKQLRCHYAAYCGLSVVCLVPFIGLRPHESSSLSRTARYTWLGRSRCSLCLVLLTACHSATLRGYCVILDILSFFALTSFLRHSVPAIMVAGICTKRTTASGLYRSYGMKDFLNWLYSMLVVAAFAFVLLVVPQLIERLI